jgi:serine/threonine protein kinase
MTQARLSSASDVYSFGIIMYEMLTWQMPYGLDDQVKYLQFTWHDGMVVAAHTRNSVVRNCLAVIGKDVRIHVPCARPDAEVVPLPT